MQIKLDESIRAVSGAQNKMVDLEELTEEELARYEARFAKLHAPVQPSNTTLILFATRAHLDNARVLAREAARGAQELRDVK